MKMLIEAVHTKSKMPKDMKDKIKQALPTSSPTGSSSKSKLINDAMERIEEYPE
jgi:hypothetical protein